MDELTQIRERYKRRKLLPEDRYSILNPATYLIEQEKERALIQWIIKNKINPIENKKLLEIGCGNGFNILRFIRLGFEPSNIYANELIEERIEEAKKILPPQINFISGNAMDINLPEKSIDIVFQSMVFSSILDNDFKENLAKKMWNLVKPGGGVLWYDFTFNNPANPDVKGVKLKEIKKLFNNEKFYVRRITLAPPLARVVTKIHPGLYNLFNAVYVLRTHLMIWIRK
jgi:ubiquinone/menaquinone biosynthesis C-methylase UbiE